MVEHRVSSPSSCPSTILNRVAYHVDTGSVIGIGKLMVLAGQYFGIFISVFDRFGLINISTSDKLTITAYYTLIFILYCHYRMCDSISLRQ